MRPAIAAVILGTVGALFPEAVINWTKRLLLGLSYENAEDLRPRDWYVSAVRIQSILMAAAGIALFAFERRETEPEPPSTADLKPSGE